MNQLSKYLLSVVSVVGVGITLFLVGGTIEKSRAPVVPVEEETIKRQEALALANQSIPEAPVTEEITVSAAGAYTLDGGVLYGLRTEKRWPIASITKLMTALVAHQALTPDATTTISETAVATEGVSGGFTAGEVMTIDDLVEAMLLVSSNDAAEAIAEVYGREAFILRMNEVAVGIGMGETAFVDPSGLSYRNLSTVEDLRKLALYVWNSEPEIFEISRRKTGYILDIKTGRGRQLESINRFARRSDFLGGKTGQIPEAEGNLLSIFSVEGRSSPVLVIVLGAGDRFLETENILLEL